MPASLFTNGVRVLESVLGVNGTVSVQRRLRLGYAVFCCMQFCCSVVLLFGICWPHVFLFCCWLVPVV